MDIRMPIMDGFEATQILKADPSTNAIPIVALTASTLQNEVDEIKSIFDGFLFKPVKKNEIINELKTFLTFRSHSESVPIIDKPNLSLEEKVLEVSNTINREFLEKFKAAFANEITEQKLFMLFDNLSDMATRIQKFASENQANGLEALAINLKKQIDAFDFENVQNCLSEIEEKFCS
jgi:response regulator RpfG family c-di-GMP phosphodiesterase